MNSHQKSEEKRPVVTAEHLYQISGRAQSICHGSIILVFQNGTLVQIEKGRNTHRN